MFSDTHFHFQKMAQQCKNGVDVLSLMAQNNCFFGLDIGTNSDDLLERQSFCEQTIAQITNHSLAEKVRNFLYFSTLVCLSITKTSSFCYFTKNQFELIVIFN